MSRRDRARSSTRGTLQVRGGVNLRCSAAQFRVCMQGPLLRRELRAACVPGAVPVGVAGSTGEVTPELILLGIWEQKEAGAGHKLLSVLGFTDENAAELRQLVQDRAPTPISTHPRWWHCSANVHCVVQSSCGSAPAALCCTALCCTALLFAKQRHDSAAGAEFMS